METASRTSGQRRNFAFHSIAATHQIPKALTHSQTWKRGGWGEAREEEATRVTRRQVTAAPKYRTPFRAVFLLRQSLRRVVLYQELSATLVRKTPQGNA